MVPILRVASSMPTAQVPSARLREDVDILVYIEHPTRELDVTCLLKALLHREYGVRLEVASKHYRDYEALRRSNPKIVCVNGFFVETKGFLRQRWFWPNAWIVNLAYEQLITKINEEIKMPVGDYAKTRMRYSAWGPFFADMLSRRGVDPSLASVNGNPVYGMYREPYSRAYMSREEVANHAGIDPSRRWVFIPENYQAAFFGDGRKARYLEVGMTAEQVEAFCSFAERCLKALCTWLHHIPEDVQVILRPRPIVGMAKFMEKVEPWLPQERSRLLISETLTAREWVLTSDVTLSSYSTTLLEAAVAGKQPAMLKPEPFPDWVGHPWYDYVDEVTSEEDFLGVLRGDSEIGQPDRLASWTEANLLASGDPVRNLAQWLAKLVEEWKQSPREQPEWVAGARWLYALARENSDKLKWAARGQKEKARPGDYFDEDDVARTTKKWAALLESTQKEKNWPEPASMS
jgi:surface carbohydrate biosynthesis protein